MNVSQTITDYYCDRVDLSLIATTDHPNITITTIATTPLYDCDDDLGIEESVYELADVLKAELYERYPIHMQTVTFLNITIIVIDRVPVPSTTVGDDDDGDDDAQHHDLVDHGKLWIFILVIVLLCCFLSVMIASLWCVRTQRFKLRGRAGSASSAVTTPMSQWRYPRHGTRTETDYNDDDDDEEEEEEAVHVRVEEEEEEAGGHRSGDWVECPICCMDRPPEKFFRATCGHNYCHICLETHYKGCIENGIVSFICMSDECERKIDENELFQFLNDDTYKQKYFKFQRNVKLAQDHNVRWCVKAGCDTPIRRKSRKQYKLECPKCGTCVCYNCAGLYFNAPAHAESGSEAGGGKSVKQQQQHHCNKQLDEKLTTWAKSGSYDVQFCPKCCARIEKLSGCNHMKCTYCKYEFCWLCRREFRKGHYDPNNILFGCPNAENAEKKPSRCSAFCLLMKSCLLVCCLPMRICCWRMSEQGFPWCCCWCCCD